MLYIWGVSEGVAQHIKNGNQLQNMEKNKVRQGMQKCNCL